MFTATIVIATLLFGTGCIGDIDGDGDCDEHDLSWLLAEWGCTGDDCHADLNDDGIVDHRDLGILLSDFGCGR